MVDLTQAQLLMEHPGPQLTWNETSIGQPSFPRRDHATWNAARERDMRDMRMDKAAALYTYR